MTNEQYDVILGLLAEKVEEQAQTIGYLRIRVGLLEDRLKAAEEFVDDSGEQPAKLEIR